MSKRGARIGAAAFVVGLSLSGPQAAGVAAADTGESDTGSVTAGPAESAAPAKARAGKRTANHPPAPASGPGAAASSAAADTEGPRGATRSNAAESKAKAARRAATRTADDSDGALTGFPATNGTGNPGATTANGLSGPVSPGTSAAASPVPSPGPSPAASTAGSAAGAASVVLGSARPATSVARRPAPITYLSAAVDDFFDSAAKWVSTLPGGAIADFLQGALVLVRRTLFGFIPSTGSGLSGGQTATASPYMTDAELREYLLGLAKQRYGSLFGTTVPVYDYYYYPMYKTDGIRPAGGGTTSDTNTQVDGVDEADLVETDGQYIYVANNGGLTILDSASNVASHTELNGYVVGQYLAGNRLTVITQNGGGWYGPMVKMAPGYWWDWNPQTTVTVYDITDRSAPVVASQSVFDGSYRDSRAVDGNVYLVLDRNLKLPAPQYTDVPVGSEQAHIDADALDYRGPEVIAYRTYETWDAYVARVGDSITTTALPHAYSVDAEGNTIDLGVVADAEHIVRPQSGDPQSLLTVVSVDSHNATGGSFASSVGTFLSSNGGTVYMTPQALYVGSAQDDSSDGGWSSNTRIDRFAIAGTDIAWQASGVVPGTLINQFAMDEYDGYLRVATHSMSSQFAGGTWATVNDNGVYVLDTRGETLDVVGSVTGLAPGEQIYAVRFDGDKGYLVTFLQTDPLFAIDLSDPTAPTVLGELVIPGFSNYLQSVGDGLLIGIGQERAPGTWNTRMHVSLFDVADGGDLTQIQRLFLDEDSQWSWSQAQFDHHAVLYSAEDGLLVVPVSGSGYDQATGSYHSENILTVMRVGADGLQVLGEIHTDEPVLRTVRIGEVIYAVSDTEVVAYSLTDMSEIGRTPLGAGRTPVPVYELQ